MNNAKSRLACGIYILALLLGLVATPSAQAQTYKVLYRFAGGTDGANPSAGLVRDAAGSLYGTTYYGGDTSCLPPLGCGTVFKVDATGMETVLHSFTGTFIGGDGAFPDASLVMDTVGDLDGTTSGGGPSNAGTVFEVNTTGTETVLYSFTEGKGGFRPVAGLVRDPAGSNLFYGTTLNGGGSHCDCGTVFKVDRTGKERGLHTFTNTPDGAFPYSSTLLPDTIGNLYGTTLVGGPDQAGTVFTVNKAGTETVLYSFTFGMDGYHPFAGLVRDSAGNLYGTTRDGGDASCNCGTVFEVNRNGTETVLHTFTGGTDGANPVAALARDSAGNLYGTTEYGGASNMGTVFKLDTSETETILHSFAGGTDGATPVAPLVRDASGNLYGTTVYGGVVNCGAAGLGCGTVFKLRP